MLPLSGQALAERERIAEYRAADERAIAEYERRQE
jgi:hypothetical protein